MKFDYSKRNLSPQAERTQRILEILPGLTSWTIIVGMTLLAVLRPFPAAVIIIAFYFYWLLRLVYMTIFLALSYYRLQIEQKTDWMERVRGIDDLGNYVKRLENAGGVDLGRFLSNRIHTRELLVLQEKGDLPPRSEEIYHLVIFPVVKESRDVLESGIQSLRQQEFPIQRMVVIYALETRAHEDIKKGVLALVEEHRGQFMDILVVQHPSGLPGEAKVKGANVTFAGRAATEYFKTKGIAFENIIVSCFDADTVVSPGYFPCLTYYFLATPNRIQASFQPIPVYHNNIWEVPGFARVIEAGSSFFQLVEATNPEKLVTFSSHSMSFKALVDVDYWPVDMISDDSAIFWKCWIHYEGNYEVIPLYVTLSMDIAGSEDFWTTVRSIYKQKRRWAWGVENLPIVGRAFLRKSGISLYDRLRMGFKLFEGHVAWATSGFLLGFIGWLPIIFARQEFQNSVMYYNAPGINNTIFRLALISLFTSIVISMGLLPKKAVADRWSVKLTHALEWLTIPFILIFFSSMPALDAQTRLMLGRYMEFWVTDKVRRTGIKTKTPTMGS